MKKLNKRLLISLVALVVSIALATTATYAWFSMNTTPSVEQFDLQVTAEDGLYVSTSATGVYSNNLTVEDLLAAYPLYNVRLKPVSTDGEAAATFVNGAPALKDMAGGAAVANTYYSFNIYFRSASPYEVSLADINMSALKSANRPTYTAWADLDDNLGAYAGEGTAPFAQGDDLTEADASMAARIAIGSGNTGVIYNIGNTDAYTDGQTINEAAHNFYEHNTGNPVTDVTEATGVLTAVTNTATYEAVQFTQVSNTEAFSDGTPVMNLYTRTGDAAPYKYTKVAIEDADADAGVYYTPLNGVNDFRTATLDDKTAGRVLYAATGLVTAGISGVFNIVEGTVADEDIGDYYVIDRDEIGDAENYAIYYSSNAANYTLLPENGDVGSATEYTYYRRTDFTLSLGFNDATNFYEGMMTVTIWIEGTDANCFEYILADLLQTSLSFTGQVGRLDYQAEADYTE